jgi:SP family general alpha glucoside:H+ symporter-like MFS transporter
MDHTDNLEQELESGTTYLDCFKGIDLRRTEICCLVFAGQNMSARKFAKLEVNAFEDDTGSLHTEL